MTVTMKDIARAAGVSKATVSKVMNGLDEHISDETRNHILKLVDQMGYVPNTVARGLKIKRTQMLGFILPDISNPFFPEIARGIEDTAKTYGFGVVMCNTDNTTEAEYERFKFLSSKMVDGIIFTRAGRIGNLDKIFESGMPIVVVDREVNVKKFGFGQIFVDTREGVRQATKILIDAGCQKVAFISAEYFSSYDRINGYYEALFEAGIPADKAVVYQDQFNVETGYDGMNEILRGQMVDGVVCGNDLIAIGVMNALAEHDIRIPEQVRVMGFDDIYFARYTTPALSTIAQPAYEMGANAAEMLVENILNGKPLYKKKLDFTIRMRGTV